MQHTRDDEPTISRINEDKNIDNEVYYVCIEFPNLPILFNMVSVSVKGPQMVVNNNTELTLFLIF